MRLYCSACKRYGHKRLDSSCPFRVIFARKRDRLTLRLPATINPDDRDKWRGFAGSYAHLGRDIEGLVRDAHTLGSHGRHATRTVSRDAIDAEVAAFRAELWGVFPEPATQPMPLVRLSSQAGIASVRGGAA